jgi:putative ABC transport system substrate-binding protein
VELIKQIIPKLVQLTTLSNPDNPGHAAGLKEIELDALASGLKLRNVTARSADDLARVFRTASEAILVMVDAFFSAHRTLIVDLAVRHRRPVVYDRSEFVEAGGLASYGMNLAELSRRAAWYVDQIIKGAKPEKLPFTEPAGFELVINLKVAKQINLTIPPNVLARADRVIR